MNWLQLSGAALETISSLELTGTNYREAVLLLKNRDNNKILHFQTHIKEIYSLKAVGTGSAGSLGILVPLSCVV